MTTDLLKIVAIYGVGWFSNTPKGREIMSQAWHEASKWIGRTSDSVISAINTNKEKSYEENA